MRKCCCCIPILGGATFLGFIAIMLCALEFVVTIPYLLKIDIDVFNPLQSNLEYLYDQLEYGFQSVINETDNPHLTEEIMAQVRAYTWTAIISEACCTGVYLIISLMMVCGIQCDMRGLMLPYMIVQMLYIILGITIGIGITVLFFFFNIIMGIVSAAVILILAFLMIYFWVAVQKVSKILQLGLGYSYLSPAYYELVQSNSISLTF